jgi:hypothetical protein
MDNDSTPTLNVHYLLSVDAIGGSNGRHFHIPVELWGQSRVQQVAAMVDCGASTPFLAHKFVKSHNVLVKRLQSLITLYNINMTPNRAGTITHTADLQMAVGEHVEKISFYVTDISPEDVVLGITWLWAHNPEIDWTAGKLSFTQCTCPRSLQGASPPEVPIQSDNAAPLAPELIATNRRVRREYLKAGILSHTTDELYVFAGYTYSQKVAKDSGRAKREHTFEEIVPEHYREFSKVFSDKESERLPEHQTWDHTTNLKEGAPEAIRAKVYPMPPNELKELDEFLEENLCRGYITPSKSPMASPIFFIKKKDGKLRLVQDYRKLNEVTIKNRCPLPLATDIINRLSGAKYFTKFDVQWGYTNVRIKEGDEWKAAFTTTRGLFEPRVMFFGLTNSPATFQALMNTIFTNLIAEGRVAVYLGNILIFSQSLHQHRWDVREVLRRLEAHDLHLCPEKCDFEQTEVEYLGMIISQGAVRMDPAKVKAVADWPTPRNLRDVRSFVGFANFYQRFIKDFSKIVRPLHDLTKKDAPFTWGIAQKQAFNTLKEAFTSKPVLALWELHRKTWLEVGTLEWEERDGLVYYKGHLYIPADKGLRQAVVEQCHDAPTAGHPGRDGTIELVSRLYWWPTLAQSVTRYVAGCDPCQRRKAGLHPPAPTQPLDVPEGPWQTVGVDLVTGLPDSDSYDAICTIVDHYTHVVHAIPCCSTIDAEGVAGLYIREIF